MKVDLLQDKKNSLFASMYYCVYILEVVQARAVKGLIHEGVNT